VRSLAGVAGPAVFRDDDFGVLSEAEAGVSGDKSTGTTAAALDADREPRLTTVDGSSATKSFLADICLPAFLR
jgi:hypothetical protein